MVYFYAVKLHKKLAKTTQLSIIEELLGCSYF